MSSSEPLFLFEKMLWDIQSYTSNGRPKISLLTGPFCQKCRYKLTVCFQDDPFKPDKTELWCEKCGKHYGIEPNQLDNLRNKVERNFYAKEFEYREVTSLDIPPTKLEVKDEDDHYFISARITQKDGRRLGVVYIGEKKEKQTKTDYSHIFIDLDTKQIRYDTTNKMPDELLTTFVCEFDNGSITTTDFKKK